MPKLKFIKLNCRNNHSKLCNFIHSPFNNIASIYIEKQIPDEVRAQYLCWEVRWQPHCFSPPASSCHYLLSPPECQSHNIAAPKLIQTLGKKWRQGRLLFPSVFVCGSRWATEWGGQWHQGTWGEWGEGSHTHMHTLTQYHEGVDTLV